MAGRWTFRRVLTAVLCAGAVSAALAAGGPDALVPFADAAGAASEVSVAFVVDFGSLGPPVVGCVQVPAGDNGYYALSAFTAEHGEAAPIYNSADLLCSINGAPANAPTVCGAQVPGGYDYWSYWHGTTGSWVYASTGAFADVQSGDVEGWRYETDGHSNPSDPPPASVPAYSSICGSVTSAPSSPTTSVPSVPPTTAAAPVAVAPVTPVRAPPQARPGTAPAATTTTATPAASGVPGSASGLGGATGGGSSVTTSPGTSPRSGPQAQSLRATPAAVDTQGADNSTIPTLIGALLVLALAGGAVIGWRRRARPQ